MSNCMNSYFLACFYLLVSSKLLLGQGTLAHQPEGSIMTITGPLPVDSVSTCLIHEHVFLDWSGAEEIDKGSWDNEKALNTILPYLQAMKRKGVRTFLECTPAYLGRNPQLLLEINDATGEVRNKSIGIRCCHRN